MVDWLALPVVALADSGAQRLTRPVAWRHGELISRARFLTDVRAWQAAFAAREGSRVALYFDDGYDFACALYGAWHAGKEVCLPGDTQADTLARLLPTVQSCAGALPGALQPTPGAVAAEAAPLSLTSTRLVVYTSGSSGEPLAIAKTLAQLDAEMQTLQRAFGARVDAHGVPRVYATVSPQHIYGLLFYTLWSLAAGRPLVAERLVYPEEMAARLGGAGASQAPSGPALLITSPAHLRRLPETLDWRAVQANLQAVFSSGGPLPSEAAQAALQHLGHSPIEVFGSSETGGVAWRQRAVQGERWTPLPGIAWRQAGELLAVQSAHLPDAQWYTTADRIEAQADGSFVLLGRADRIVKIEEKRVSITAMEAALQALPELAQARLVVLATEQGARLAVVAVPSAAGWALAQSGGKRALNECLRQALLATVERVALPRRFRYVHSLPVNAQGKCTEALLAKLFRPHCPVPNWLEREAGHARAQLEIAADLLVFDGHFDQVPILPGVAQLDWAIHFARSCFELPAQFVRAEGLKFQKPVLPGMRVELALRWRVSERVLSFVYSSVGDAGVHASGNVVFANEPRPEGAMHG